MKLPVPTRGFALAHGRSPEMRSVSEWTMVNDYDKVIPMKKVSISRFKATCLELLRLVQETGEPILITKRGEALAEVRPPQSQESRSPLGIMKARTTILGDVTSPAVAPDEWDVLKR